MRIKFTHHAKIRCVERKISEKWVTFHLQRIPLSQGTHEHTIEGTNLTVVYHDGKSNRTVITLYSVVMEKIEQPKKKVDLAPFSDMLKKEKKKHDRRKKQSRKNKFKKR